MYFDHHKLCSMFVILVLYSEHLCQTLGTHCQRLETCDCQSFFLHISDVKEEQFVKNFAFSLSPICQFEFEKLGFYDIIAHVKPDRLYKTCVHPTIEKRAIIRVIQYLDRHIVLGKTNPRCATVAADRSE